VLQDMRKPSMPQSRDRVISWREIRALLRHLERNGRNSVSWLVAQAFWLSLETGMRASEICGLQWANIRPTVAVLPLTKNGKRREVPLSRRAQRIVTRLRGWDEAKVLPITPQTLDALFRRARAACGLQGFVFHDSRHTAATRIAELVRGGRISIFEFCDMFGWSSTKQALTYVKVSAAAVAGRL
jgi:integrase